MTLVGYSSITTFVEHSPVKVSILARIAPLGYAGRLRVGGLVALVATSVVASLVNPSASVAGQDDDELRQRQHAVDTRIDEAATEIHEISRELVRAQRLLERAEADLSAARSSLASLQRQVAQAELDDQAMQGQLENAQIRLQNARSDLKSGRIDVSASRGSLASYAVSNYQSGGIGLSSLEVAFDSQSAEDAVDSFQDIDTVVNKESMALQELQAREVLLALTQDRVLETKRSVRESRLLAAEHLANKLTLQAEAAQAEQEVTLQVQTLSAEQDRVAAAKLAELKSLRQLERERDRIEQMLLALAERRAERQAQRRSERHATPPASPQGVQPGAPPTPVDDGGILAYPGDSTYVTSLYGMRIHPILKVTKLHDGLDLAAACGSQVYAAADGRVLDAYFNSGYGNRIIIDHGYLAGASLATSYNHMNSLLVGPGESVTKGQLIGYAGTTGYSTGCHMHFMVYVNGATVDPLGWL